MTSARPPNAATGSPPPITLPNVIRSGTAEQSRPNQPARETRKPVMTSSLMNSAPCARHSSARPALNPGTGGTTPMFAAAASVITHAMSAP